MSEEATTSPNLSEKALKTLCKVTGLPHGLFNETSQKVRGGLTQFVFDCPAESDEYEILIDPKQKVIQIKNAYTTWEREIIDALVKEADEPPRPAVGVGVQPQTAPTAVLAPVQPTYNMPPQPTLINPTSLTQAVAQYIADYVKLNPGCIWTQIDPANPTCVNETILHNNQNWIFHSLSVEEDYSTNTQYYALYFRAGNTGDPRLDEDVKAIVNMDMSTLNITNIEVEE